MRVLAVNPGATSTKLAVHDGDGCLASVTVEHDDAETEALAGHDERLAHRLGVVREALAAHGFGGTRFDAVAGRGGLLKPVPGGTYRVDDEMLADLRTGARGRHAANLGGGLADLLARGSGAPAFVVDPVSTDEIARVARVTGLPSVPRAAFCHALNMKAVARLVASRRGLAYPEARLVVAHLGTGISLSAHAGGRMVDVSNGRDEGAMSADRPGSLPASALVDLCFAPGATRETLAATLNGGAGMRAWLGTRDLRAAQARAAAGDGTAALFLEALEYQVAKQVGMLAAVLRGRVDAVALTGGMAHSEALVAGLTARTAWIAPVVTVPGEHELMALAGGALRVLRGEEPALDYASARVAVS